MSKFLPKDEILSIKSVDLFTYLKTCFPSELQLFCNGTYTTKTHSSLKISNGLWHYFKEGIGGKNGVDLSWSIQNACLPSISKYPTFVPLQVTPEDDKFVTVAA